MASPFSYNSTASLYEQDHQQEPNDDMDLSLLFATPNIDDELVEIEKLLSKKEEYKEDFEKNCLALINDIEQECRDKDAAVKAKNHQIEDLSKSVNELKTEFAREIKTKDSYTKILKEENISSKICLANIFKRLDSIVKDVSVFLTSETGSAKQSEGNEQETSIVLSDASDDEVEVIEEQTESKATAADGNGVTEKIMMKPEPVRPENVQNETMEQDTLIETGAETTEGDHETTEVEKENVAPQNATNEGYETADDVTDEDQVAVVQPKKRRYFNCKFCDLAFMKKAHYLRHKIEDHNIKVKTAKPKGKVRVGPSLKRKLNVSDEITDDEDNDEEEEQMYFVDEGEASGVLRAHGQVKKAKKLRRIVMYSPE